MEGLGLLNLLIDATGLPKDALETEIQQILEERGFRAETLTLDQVRDVLSVYLQNVLLAAKNSAC